MRRISDLTYEPVVYKDLPAFKKDNIIEAIPALKRSCEVMLKQSQKTYPVPSNSSLDGTLKDWHPFCKAVLEMNSSQRADWENLIQKYLTPYKLLINDNDQGHFTGYYEPLLHGSKRRHGRYKIPLYRYPSDASINVKIPRADIVNGALKNKKLELVWVDNAIDAFFIQIQGSGRVKLENGEIMKIGYAGTNKHAYHAIGKTLFERGELERGKISMQSIKQWLKSHPRQAEDVMSTNESYVFFKELKNDDGPIGSQGVALTAKRSIAVDPFYIGLGAPLWIDIEHPDDSKKRIQQLIVAQDTGGAIKGGLRADYFWGFGEEATDYAGKMNCKELSERSSDGRIVLPRQPTKVKLQERVWTGEASQHWLHQDVQRLTQKEMKKKKIEGRIDLHGYTRNEAESALKRFFNWAQTSNMHYVLVITGKGGVLKTEVPLWFKKHPEFVVSFNEALPKDGGSGAYYVHVRRMRGYEK
eukprot:gene25141-32798_t